MSRLSVLMPAYNAAGTVAGAVRSTLRDLPRDAELVVLDDGSTDGTADRVRAFADPRVRLRSRPNTGVAAALGELLDATDSEFVARMDADDLVLPGRFRRQLRALDGTRGPEAVFTTVVSWGAGGPRVPRPSEIGHAEFGFHLLLTNPVAHSTLMARRSAVAAVGGYRSLPTEDYDLWLRLAASGARLQRMALPGIAYRVHPGQVTASEGWRRRSWTDPELGAAYAALSESLLGEPSTRITSLSIDDALTSAEKRERFDAFAARFEAALGTHAPAARRALRRKLAERRAWFEKRVAAGEPSEAGRAGPASASVAGSGAALEPGMASTAASASAFVTASTAASASDPPLAQASTPRQRYRAACAADREANAAYPKSRLVLRWFRSAQRWRATRGPLARLMFIAVGGSYKLVSEGCLAIELPVSTSVGPGLRLRHGFGVVVNPASRIGARVMLRHGVTLGNRKAADDCPVVEDDVEIGVGAVIVGSVTIGRGARIGPNAVVLHDVPAGGVVYSPRCERDRP